MPESQQDFFDRLQKAITSYYTVSYSADTDLYAILNMYAAEFASGSAKIFETYGDLFVLSASGTKLYDNFGVYFGIPRYFAQDVDSDGYNTLSGSLPAYRKSIDFLMDSAMHGGTVHSINRVVNAFTLINPDIREHYDYRRWSLRAVSGSIMATDGIVLTLANDPGWRRNEWVGAVATLYSGSQFVSEPDGEGIPRNSFLCSVVDTSTDPVSDIVETRNDERIFVLYIVTANTQNTVTLGPLHI